MYIASAGIISSLGRGLSATEKALRANRSGIAPLHVFPVLHGDPLPVGQASDFKPDCSLPRTHQLAREASSLAMAGETEPPDAIILGCTTGGILTTEQLLRDKVADQEAFRHHGLLSVASDLAAIYGCSGPALMVSTACSSSAVAITLAMNLMRTGTMRRVLAGGVDSLSRLTYFGFHSLQLVDVKGCKPMDADRHGISVAEGAAMLLLTSSRPKSPLAVLLGAGLSCDAHHPTAPHPEGAGALRAMQNALADAGVQPSDIDYINLHGTGTPDNDLSESKAVRTLFSSPPPLSSIKGATGHSLAAAGAIGAVTAGLAASRGFIPGNVGCRHPDPALGLTPQADTVDHPVRIVLSNSFGFGGNNGSLVIGRADTAAATARVQQRSPLAVHGSACLTGSGPTQETLTQLGKGKPVAGMMPSEQLGKLLPPRLVRRVKRLARMSLLLATSAVDAAGELDKPSAVFLGTGWGALSETYDFLNQLTVSDEQFPSPTDFVGSVHNGAAGQIAMLFKATGANVTTSGGDYSFEQALLAADTLLDESGQSALLVGVDEAHASLSPLLDPSIPPGNDLADGGGAFYINRNPVDARCLVRMLFYGRDSEGGLPEQLMTALGGEQKAAGEYAAVFAGIPAATSQSGNRQLDDFEKLTGRLIPVCRYRRFLGQFTSASAVASTLAAAYIEAGFIPGVLFDGDDIILAPHHKILVLGTGHYLTAMEFSRP